MSPTCAGVEAPARPFPAIDLRGIRPELLQVVLAGTHARDMEPDHAERVGRGEANRRGEILGRGLGLAGIELRASAVAIGETQIGVDANGCGGIRNRLSHGALGEMRPSPQAVRIGVVGREANGFGIIRNSPIRLAFGEIGITAIAVRDGEIGVGQSTRRNRLIEQPDGVVPLALVQRVRACPDETRGIGAGREAGAGHQEQDQDEPNDRAQHHCPLG